jgi:hypothetical protein
MPVKPAIWPNLIVGPSTGAGVTGAGVTGAGDVTGPATGAGVTGAGVTGAGAGAPQPTKIKMPTSTIIRGVRSNFFIALFSFL